MNYVKHVSNDLVYGELTGNLFIQHKWTSLNVKQREGIARGNIAQFEHICKEIDQSKDFIQISQSEYESLFYNDFKRH